MIQLVLSLDYEVFGNGSGDVRRDIIEPTQRLLELCDKYGAKVSIFFEVGEYWAMKKAERDGLLNLNYSPSIEIEKQVQLAAKNGHDVQLHLHPWWIGAEFVNSKWQLNPEYRRITDLPNGMGNENDIFSIVGVLSQGKETLENIIKPVCPDYECLTYRAGAFWAQPSKDLIAGIKKAGLIADSSVVQGLIEEKPILTDYRRAKSSIGYWWTNEEDISLSGIDGENIIEFPVYSKIKSYLCNFKWTKLSATLKRRKNEKEDPHGHGMKKARQSTDSSKTILRKLFSTQPIKYDFCKLSAKDMIQGLKQAIKDNGLENKTADTPVILLGHCKDYWNDKNLEKFLGFVKNRCSNNTEFSTYTVIIKKIIGNR